MLKMKFIFGSAFANLVRVLISFAGLNIEILFNLNRHRNVECIQCLVSENIYRYARYAVISLSPHTHAYTYIHTYMYIIDIYMY